MLWFSKIRNPIFLLVSFLLSTSAWSSVFVHWTISAVPPAHELGITDLVISWNQAASPLVKTARKQGYRVFVDVPVEQANAAAEKLSPSDVAGVFLNVRQSERAQLQDDLSHLRSAHPKIKFLVLNSDAKQPQMRGSLVIKRGSVLEVSSPTAQPWIDTNLAVVKIEQRSTPSQIPLYTFAWQRSDAAQQEPTITAADYSLAVAEAGAFHADLILEMDEHLQKALAERDPKALRLWSQVRPYADFYSHSAQPGLSPAANVAIISEELDTSDESMNLLARHNIPFKVFLPGDLKGRDVEHADVIVVFAKPDSATSERIADLARQGKTVVLVDAHGSYPWQNTDALRLNEHASSYSVGNGKVLELSEPVTDPETFAQDIRRLLGKQNALISLWNGLTTVAVLYGHDASLKVLELINYAQDPVRVQVQVKGSFSSIRYETPGRRCCETLVPVQHDGFTEFVIPDLHIAGRVHLGTNQASDSQ